MVAGWGGRVAGWRARQDEQGILLLWYALNTAFNKANRCPDLATLFAKRVEG